MSRRMLLSTTSLGCLVTWKPTYTQQDDDNGVEVPFSCRIVNIQSLEPDDIMPIESLWPAPVVPIASLAPKLVIA